MICPIDGAGKLLAMLQKHLWSLSSLWDHYKSRQEIIEKSLEQTKVYLDRVGHHEGHLLIFNRDPARSWEDKVFKEIHEIRGRRVAVWRMKSSK